MSSKCKLQGVGTEQATGIPIGAQNVIDALEIKVWTGDFDSPAGAAASWSSPTPIPAPALPSHIEPEGARMTAPFVVGATTSSARPRTAS